MSLSKVFISAIVCSFLIACSKNNPPAVGTLQKDGRVLVSEEHAMALTAEGKPKQAADEYVEIGELLLVPKGIEYADEMFEKAIAADPTNARANFYSALVKPWVALRGFGARLSRLRQSDSRTPVLVQRRLENTGKILAKISEVGSDLPKLREYVLNRSSEKPTFRTYNDLQRFFKTELLPAFSTSADRLGAILKESTMLRINFDPGRWGGIKESERSSYKWSECRQTGYGYNTTWNCYYEIEVRYIREPADSQLVTVDYYDIKLLRGGLLGLIDALRLGTAYSLDGFDSFMQELSSNERRSQKELKRSLNTQEIVSLLQKRTGLFTLLSEHELSKIPVTSEEMIRHFIDLSTLDEEICQVKNRRNNFFLSICLAEDLLPNLESALDLLGGPKSLPIGRDLYGSIVEIVVDASAFYKGSNTDLKTLFPSKFGVKGEPTEYPDPTIGGLFPNGDLIEKLKQVH